MSFSSTNGCFWIYNLPIGLSGSLGKIRDDHASRYCHKPLADTLSNIRKVPIRKSQWSMQLTSLWCLVLPDSTHFALHEQRQAPLEQALANKLRGILLVPHTWRSHYRWTELFHQSCNFDLGKRIGSEGALSSCSGPRPTCECSGPQTRSSSRPRRGRGLGHWAMIFLLLFNSHPLTFNILI